MVTVTVKPNMVLSVNCSGFIRKYVAGNTPSIPAGDVKSLRRAGVIV